MSGYAASALPSTTTRICVPIGWMYAQCSSSLLVTKENRRAGMRQSNSPRAESSVTRSLGETDRRPATNATPHQATHQTTANATIPSHNPLLTRAHLKLPHGTEKITP